MHAKADSITFLAFNLLNQGLADSNEKQIDAERCGIEAFAVHERLVAINNVWRLGNYKLSTSAHFRPDKVKLSICAPSDRLFNKRITNVYAVH